MNKLLEFDNVVLGYEGKPVLPPLCTIIEQGDFLGVVGPNGAGKTTMLKALLGLLKPLKGKLIFDKKHRFGYVPQRENISDIFPLTTRDVVMMSRFPLTAPYISPRKSDREAVEKALSMAGIENIAHKFYRSLSGGQKQRTLIARALAPEPDMLILDEPTNGMDISAEKSIMDLISGLNRKGITIVMVTHLLNLVVNRANKLLFLNHQIIQGKTEEILTGNVLSEIYKEKVEVCRHDNNQYHIEIRN